MPVFWHSWLQQNSCNSCWQFLTATSKYLLLNSIHIKFNVIRITESHLKLNVQPLVNINLKKYNIEKTPTELEKGGALLYISCDINYKVHKDLNIYGAKELESIFIETITKNRKNCIIGCIYKHPKMSI